MISLVSLLVQNNSTLKSSPTNLRPTHHIHPPSLFPLIISPRQSRCNAIQRFPPRGLQANFEQRHNLVFLCVQPLTRDVHPVNLSRKLSQLPIHASNDTPYSLTSSTQHLKLRRNSLVCLSITQNCAQSNHLLMKSGNVARPIPVSEATATANRCHKTTIM
ncbi:hypothetical protein K461DRAFT_281735 [Myriangium duriaei CBS 260.36]|uniref:Uncharacterized protein n=1 Tax=Myriangium duriaei CBS 260.36 TaxID=1168546 RepID=A0A9P4IZ16_9PEZI|nr:hypothetical protein K461DRAFT_281735 [Myriangium duriaei CBS 260.36]